MKPLPGFWEVARRSEWIWTLIACLLVAGVFGVLANWQTSRAIEQGQSDDRDTETAVALDTVHAPSEILTTEAGGRLVTVEAVVQPQDFMFLDGRHQEGEVGCWVISRGVVASGEHAGASIAFAAEFVADCDGADARLAELAAAATGEPVELVGRYMPTEAPQQAEFEEGQVSMSIAWLVNLWEDYEAPVYAGYLILHDPANPGETLSIHSVPPEQQVGLNWLNVFYAIEWVAFGGFALYLWYRLVQDAREREGEEPDDFDDLDGFDGDSALVDADTAAPADER